MEAERRRVTEREGGVGVKGGSVHPGKRRDREKERQTEEERERGDGGKGAS